MSEEKQKAARDLIALTRAPVLLTQDQEKQVYELKIEILKKIEEFAPRFTGSLMMLPSKLQWYVDHSAYTSWQSWSTPPVAGGTSFLNAYITGLTSWSELNQVFEALGLMGVEADKWTSHDDARSYTRIYQHIGFLHERIYLRIHGTLIGDTDECKRVLVGYTSDDYRSELTSEPIYKLVCE